jgi:hypothetical protein
VELRGGKFARRTWNRELTHGALGRVEGAASRFPPTNYSVHAAGTAMESGSDKYRRFEQEFLIPVGFGWMVIVMALYLAAVVLK